MGNYKNLTPAQYQQAMARQTPENLASFKETYQEMLTYYMLGASHEMQAVWDSYMDLQFNSYTPVAYVNTRAIRAAFDPDIFARSFTVDINANGGLTFTHDYAFSVEKIQEMHNAARKTTKDLGELLLPVVSIFSGTHQGPKQSLYGFMSSKAHAGRKKEGIRPLDFDIAVAQSAGLMAGSLHPQKGGYFTEYFTAGANRAGSPRVYSNPQRGGRGENQQAPPYDVIYNFFFALGLIADRVTPPTSGDWTIKIVAFADLITYTQGNPVKPAVGGFMSALIKFHETVLRSSKTTIGRRGNKVRKTLKGTTASNRATAVKNTISEVLYDYCNKEYAKRRFGDTAELSEWYAANIAPYIKENITAKLRKTKTVKKSKPKLAPNRPLPSSVPVAASKREDTVVYETATAEATIAETIAEIVQDTLPTQVELFKSLMGKTQTFIDRYEALTKENVRADMLETLLTRLHGVSKAAIAHDPYLTALAAVQMDLINDTHIKTAMNTAVLAEASKQLQEAVADDITELIGSDGALPGIDDQSSEVIDSGDEDVLNLFLEYGYPLTGETIDLVKAMCAKKEFADRFAVVQQKDGGWYLVKR